MQKTFVKGMTDNFWKKQGKYYKSPAIFHEIS